MADADQHLGSGVALVLLAAGRSERFAGNKLRADFGGKPLLAATIDQLMPLQFRTRICVAGPAVVEIVPDSFSVLLPDLAKSELAHSIRTGIVAAVACGAQAVMISLADMPLVPTRHYRALLQGFTGDRMATSVGQRLMPPALFGASRFDSLLRLEGDRGAAALLNGAPSVALSPALARDIDTPDDLAQ